MTLDEMDPSRPSRPTLEGTAHPGQGEASTSPRDEAILDSPRGKRASAKLAADRISKIFAKKRKPTQPVLDSCIQDEAVGVPDSMEDNAEESPRNRGDVTTLERSTHEHRVEEMDVMIVAEKNPETEETAGVRMDELAQPDNLPGETQGPHAPPVDILSHGNDEVPSSSSSHPIQQVPIGQAATSSSSSVARPVKSTGRNKWYLSMSRYPRPNDLYGVHSTVQDEGEEDPDDSPVQDDSPARGEANATGTAEEATEEMAVGSGNLLDERAPYSPLLTDAEFRARFDSYFISPPSSPRAPVVTDGLTGGPSNGQTQRPTGPSFHRESSQDRRIATLLDTYFIDNQNWRDEGDATRTQALPIEPVTQLYLNDQSINQRLHRRLLPIPRSRIVIPAVIPVIEVGEEEDEIPNVGEAEDTVNEESTPAPVDERVTSDEFRNKKTQFPRALSVTESLIDSVKQMVQDIIAWKGHNCVELISLVTSDYERPEQPTEEEAGTDGGGKAHCHRTLTDAEINSAINSIFKELFPPVRRALPGEEETKEAKRITEEQFLRKRFRRLLIVRLKLINLLHFEAVSEGSIKAMRKYEESDEDMAFNVWRRSHYARNFSPELGPRNRFVYLYAYYMSKLVQMETDLESAVGSKAFYRRLGQDKGLLHFQCPYLKIFHAVVIRQLRWTEHLLFDRPYLKVSHLLSVSNIDKIFADFKSLIKDALEWVEADLYEDWDPTSPLLQRIYCRYHRIDFSPMWSDKYEENVKRIEGLHLIDLYDIQNAVKAIRKAKKRLKPHVKGEKGQQTCVAVPTFKLALNTIGAKAISITWEDYVYDAGDYLRGRKSGPRDANWKESFKEQKMRNGPNIYESSFHKFLD